MNRLFRVIWQRPEACALYLEERSGCHLSLISIRLRDMIGWAGRYPEYDVRSGVERTAVQLMSQVFA